MRQEVTTTTQIRRILAAAITVVAVGAATMTYLVDGWAPCEVEAVAERDGEGHLQVNETTATCAPIAASELLPALVLVVLLLAPDFTSIKIPGLVELERRVEQQTAEVARIGADVRVAAANLTAVSQRIDFGPRLMTPDAARAYAKEIGSRQAGGQPVDEATPLEVVDTAPESLE